MYHCHFNDICSAVQTHTLGVCIQIYDIHWLLCDNSDKLSSDNTKLDNNRRKRVENGKRRRLGTDFI